MTVFLCGQKSCGKTSWGNIISKHIQVPFYDMDALILADNKCFVSCREIYNTKGREVFRKMEADTLDKFILNHDRNQNCIFSMGGGSFESPGLANKANCFGKTVYIYEKMDVLYSRMKKDGFPSFLINDPDSLFPPLFRKRDELYRTNCNVTVDFSDLSLEEICQTVSALF